jgi:hypothetical protein
MSEKNVQFVRRWWAGFNESGLPSFELCDERIELIIPAKKRPSRPLACRSSCFGREAAIRFA